MQSKECDGYCACNGIVLVEADYGYSRLRGRGCYQRFVVRAVRRRKVLFTFPRGAPSNLRLLRTSIDNDFRVAAITSTSVQPLVISLAFGTGQAKVVPIICIASYRSYCILVIDLAHRWRTSPLESQV